MSEKLHYVKISGVQSKRRRASRRKKRLSLGILTSFALVSMIYANDLAAAEITIAADESYTANGETYQNIENSGNGAIYSNRGSLIITEGSYENNSAATMGGVIANMNGGTLEISESSFVTNTAQSSYGGGVIYNSGGNYTTTITEISESEFIGNEALYVATNASNQYKATGGAILNFMGGTIEIISDNLFQENVAERNGGAISNSNMTTVTIGGSTIDEISNNDFIRNVSTENGGAISNEYQTADGKSSTISLISENTFEGNIAGSNGGAISNANGGVITEISGNTFSENEADSYGGAIYNADLTYDDDGEAESSSNSIDTIEGNNFVENTALNGGAIYNGAEATIGSITSNTFSSNTTTGSGTQYGGAIFNAGTIESIEENTFDQNTSARGGAIYNTGEIGTISSTFTGNNVSSFGGAINNAGTILEIKDSTFEGNTSGSYGGAVLNGHGSYIGVISDSYFIDNTSFDNYGGGAIYITNTSVIDEITNVTFSGNAAEYDENGASPEYKGSGGAISNFMGGTINSINNSTFDGNTAQNNGGAISNSNMVSGTQGGSYIGEIVSTTFVNNTAGNNGGAISNEFVTAAGVGSTIALISESSFENNSATMGGAISNAEGAIIESISSSKFTGNSASDLGGAIYNAGTMSISDTTITGNTAGENGGGIYLAETGTLSFAGTNVIEGNTVNDVANDIYSEGATITITDGTTTVGAVTTSGTIDVNDGATLAITTSGDIAILNIGDEGTLNVAGSSSAEAVVVITDALTMGEASELSVSYGSLEVASFVDASNSTLTLDNATLSSGQDVTLSTIGGQGTVAAAGTLALLDDYTSSEDDDITLEGNELVLLGGLDSSDGTVNLLAANTLTAYDSLSLSGDTLDAGKLVLASSLTATGASELRVGQFGDGTSSVLDQIVVLGGGSMLVHGDGASTASTTADLSRTSTYVALSTLQLAEGGALYVGEVTTDEAENNSIVFGSGSALVIDYNAFANDNPIFTSEVEGATAYVAEGSILYLANATVDSDLSLTFFGEGFDEETVVINGWDDPEYIVLDTGMLDGVEGSITVNDANDVYPGLSSQMAAALNLLYSQALNNVESAEQGVRFLSRATNNQYIGADKNSAVRVVESAARMALAGAVPQMAKMASDAAGNAVVSRLGMANPGDSTKAMGIDGTVSGEKKTGLGVWILPLWQNMHGFGMEAGNLDYGFNANLGGIAIGADYTFESALRVGLMLNLGGGYAESEGDLSSTSNSMNFWGIGAYAGWEYQNFALLGDVAYTKTFNSLEQDMDRAMGMSNLEADVEASVISAGLRAEYKIATPVLELLPHVGVRYMSVNVFGYDVENSLGTVLEGDGFHQNIWTFPVGISFLKEFKYENGWFFSPLLDVTLIPAAGDVKAKHDVAFTGLSGSYEMETQMMDYLTWQGSAGVKFGNDTVNIGINYTLQTGASSTGHGVYGVLRFEF